MSQNHPNCSVSTGIHEGLTFGSGELDYYGYWEIPCVICARAHEQKHPEEALLAVRERRRMKMKMNKNLAHAIRILNLLDVYDHTLHLVHFYATEEDRRVQRSTITLRVQENEGYLQVAGSMALPTNDWGNHVAAYRRAEEFLRLSGLRDSRYE